MVACFMAVSCRSNDSATLELAAACLRHLVQTGKAVTADLVAAGVSPLSPRRSASVHNIMVAIAGHVSPVRDCSAQDTCSNVQLSPLSAPHMSWGRVFCRFTWLWAGWVHAASLLLLAAQLTPSTSSAGVQGSGLAGCRRQVAAAASGCCAGAQGACGGDACGVQHARAHVHRLHLDRHSASLAGCAPCIRGRSAGELPCANGAATATQVLLGSLLLARTKRSCLMSSAAEHRAERCSVMGSCTALCCSAAAALAGWRIKLATCLRAAQQLTQLHAGLPDPCGEARDALPRAVVLPAVRGDQPRPSWYCCRGGCSRLSAGPWRASAPHR